MSEDFDTKLTGLDKNAPLEGHAEGGEGFFAKLTAVFSMIKIAHTIFAMPFAAIGVLWGATYVGARVGHSTGHSSAMGAVNFDNLLWAGLWVVVAMVGARSYAMTANRLIDAKIDAANPRTAKREIPSGAISQTFAKGFAFAMAGLFVFSAWMLNDACFLLSPIALVVITAYSYMKRFTPLCHLVLGLGLSFAPIGGFLALAGNTELSPWLLAFGSPATLLGLGVLCWVAGFDIIYSLQDEAYDRENGLHSIPVWLGSRGALLVSRLLHLSAIGAWFWAFLLAREWRIDSGVIAMAGLALVAACLVYEQSLVKHDDLSKVNASFFTLNGIVGLVFAFAVFIDSFLIGTVA